MPKPSLCLNMIVKNEGARIVRALTSVTATVKAICILDTGSTDGTPDLIRQFAIDNAIPCVVETGTFENFSQARNDAFTLAQRLNGNRLPWCQFALLMDADMELVVEDDAAFKGLNASAPAYDMTQKGGAVSYVNRRILNLSCRPNPYVGVTHEYIDVPADALIVGARFVDHADGSNRKDKFPRDAALLEAALKNEPENGRYWYYLGNTYRDWGKPRRAAAAYQRRIALGGWDEETHSAMMYLAWCMRDQGDHAGFVAKMIEAYAFRPSRAEPLYDLALYYQERGNNTASVLFSKPGLTLKKPNDTLFVNDYVYSHGLRFTYSVCGSYSDADRDSAFQITNDLALDPTCPDHIRWGARSNLYWHTKPLKDYCPSVVAAEIKGFTAPAGYTAMNPSVISFNTRMLCNIRCVNYRMDDAGRYLINGTDGTANDSNPIDTRNFICSLDDNLQVIESRELIWERGDPKYKLVTGLEDVRLYQAGGALWFIACVRELDENGRCQQARGQIILLADGSLAVRRLEIISGWSDNYAEKNWMPMIDRGDQQFVYRLDTIVYPETTPDRRAATINPVSLHVKDISGSSQLIPFKAGWLAVVHEASTALNGNRTYWHRFAWFDKDGALRRLSLPFVFYERQIEFCTGLAYHPNNSDLIISFGVRDAAAHLATVSIEEVALMLWKFHES